MMARVAMAPPMLAGVNASPLCWGTRAPAATHRPQHHTPGTNFSTNARNSPGVVCPATTS